MSLATLLLCAVTIEARGGPRAIKYRGGDEGPVTFNHRLHASKGIRCNDCHANFIGTGKQLFATRKKGLVSFEDHATETKCFACHDGKVVPVKEAQVSLYEWSHASDDCNHCHYSNKASATAAGPGGGTTQKRLAFTAEGDGSIKQGTTDTRRDSNPKLEVRACANTNSGAFLTSQKTERLPDN